MPRESFVCGMALMLWFGLAEIVPGEEKVDVVPAPARGVALQRNVATAAAPEEYIVMQLVVVEVRGDTQRALKEAGFRESAAGNRYIQGTDRRVARDSETTETLLSTLRAHAEVDVLSRPVIRTITGQSSSVSIAQRARIPYLVRTGKKSFELREATELPSLGITINLTAQAAADPQQIELSQLKISMTTLDGREEIPGLDLDVGKPIVSTRTLESSVTLIDGAESCGIVVPGPPGRQPVLFLNARRVRTNSDEELPNPIPDAPAATSSPVPETRANPPAP